MTLSGRSTRRIYPLETADLALVVLGFVVFAAAYDADVRAHPALYLLGSLGLITLGGIIYGVRRELKKSPGGKNNGVYQNPVTSHGGIAWFFAVLLIGFYVLLYWIPGLLGNWVALVDPLARILSGGEADRWFFYGTLYTMAILVMGARMLVRYRDNRYHIIRTISVMAFQLLFAYLVPAIMKQLNQPEFYFSYFWPLSYYELFPDNISSLLNHPGGLGPLLVFWAALMSFVAVPVLTYFFGKRWYCSWVCGCGGLAETLGDPFRHLSFKTLRSWRVERWMIHGVLVFAVITTGSLWLNSLLSGAIFGGLSGVLASLYGFLIGALFAGVIGTGFYPFMGNRVWCRFGCPLAALLGIFQRFNSRFRITTNGGQCMSCGNCSTYCEMGIDVRWYAQRRQNIIRASCVGCGICAAVCPRGVLRLENGPQKGRYNRDE